MESPSSLKVETTSTCSIESLSSLESQLKFLYHEPESMIPYLIDWLIDFNVMATRLGLFYA